MVRIRLRRNGFKKQTTYRIIAADKECPRDGRFLEILGSYNPRTEPFTFQVKEDRIYHWLMNGAQPSESVAKLFRSVGLDKRFDRYKAGEPLETILAEAAEYYEKRVIEFKTSAVKPKNKISKRQQKKLDDAAEAAKKAAAEEEAAKKAAEEAAKAAAEAEAAEEKPAEE